MLRELKYIIDLYENKCDWATQMKELILQAISLKAVLATSDYYGPNEKRNDLEKMMVMLLQNKIDEAHSKAKTLQKSLRKHQHNILTFLWYADVPADNNGSERAIRNIKIKQKISGQFKTEKGANGFAVIRSIIDTVIKSGQNVMEALTLIAKLGAEYLPFT